MVDCNMDFGKEINMKKIAIIFLPEAGIYLFLRSLSILGDCLKKEGYDVYLVNCNGVLFRCPMMPCYQMPFIIDEKQKREKCAHCAKNFNNALKAYSFKTVNLKEYIDEQLIDDIENLLPVNTKKWDEIEYKNLKVGKIAIHDLILETKVLGVENLSEEQQILYGNYIKNTALMFEIADKIIKKKSPSIILVFNPYAQCQGVLGACRINNVKFKEITNLCTDLSIYKFTDFDFAIDNTKHCQNWNNGSKIVLSSELVQNCFDDIIFRMYGSGSHIFSSAKAENPEYIHKILKLDKNKKNIGIFTGSYDERLGIDAYLSAWGEKINPKEVFPSQIEWLKFLKDFAKTREDVQFIVRIHPREAKGGNSEHLKLLKKEFSKNSKNFFIIWPDDNISSYDLIEIIDGCLISGSTMGQECRRVGIETLSYTKNANYPNSGFIEIAEDIDDYKIKLENLINSIATINSLILAIRYYNWMTFINSLAMGKFIPKDAVNETLYPAIPQKIQKLTLNIIENKISLIDYNIQNLIKQNNSKEEEIKSVRLGIRRVIDKIYFPNPFTKKSLGWKIRYRLTKIFTRKKISFVPKYIYNDYDLKYSEDISKLNDFVNETKNNKNIRYILKDGVYAILIQNGKIFKRTSKMISNLARIHEEA